MGKGKKKLENAIDSLKDIIKDKSKFDKNTHWEKLIAFNDIYYQDPDVFNELSDEYKDYFYAIKDIFEKNLYK